MAACALAGCALTDSGLAAFDREQNVEDRLPDAVLQSGLPVEPDTSRMMWEENDDTLRLYAAKGAEARQICLLPVSADDEPFHMACGTGLPIVTEVPDQGTYLLGAPQDGEKDEWVKLAEDLWRPR